MPSQEFVRQVGNVEISQEAFMAVLKLNDTTKQNRIFYN